MIFRIFALLIMILFYSIYFGKMIIQKRQGIKTRQLGKGKNQNVRTIEILISIATLIIIPIQLIILQMVTQTNLVKFIHLVAKLFVDYVEKIILEGLGKVIKKAILVELLGLVRLIILTICLVKVMVI